MDRNKMIALGVAIALAIGGMLLGADLKKMVCEAPSVVESK